MQRSIVGYRCLVCETLHYPFRMRCKQCGELEPFQFTPEPLPSQGTLLTFTIVHNLPVEFEVATLGLGIVELANGIRMTAQIDIAEPELGMEVKGEVEVVRRQGYDDFYGMVFRAA